MCLGVKLVTFMSEGQTGIYKSGHSAERGGTRVLPQSVCGLRGDTGAEGTGDSEKRLRTASACAWKDSLGPESAQAAVSQRKRQLLLRLWGTRPHTPPTAVSHTAQTRRSHGTPPRRRLQRNFLSSHDSKSTQHRSTTQTRTTPCAFSLRENIVCGSYNSHAPARRTSMSLTLCSTSPRVPAPRRLSRRLLGSE